MSLSRLCPFLLPLETEVISFTWCSRCPLKSENISGAGLKMPGTAASSVTSFRTRQTSVCDGLTHLPFYLVK